MGQRASRGARLWPARSFPGRNGIDSGDRSGRWLAPGMPSPVITKSRSRLALSLDVDRLRREGARWLDDPPDPRREQAGWNPERKDGRAGGRRPVRHPKGTPPQTVSRPLPPKMSSVSGGGDRQAATSRLCATAEFPGTRAARCPVESPRSWHSLDPRNAGRTDQSRADRRVAHR